jgi:hypothetical protein
VAARKQKQGRMSWRTVRLFQRQKPMVDAAATNCDLNANANRRYDRPFHVKRPLQTAAGMVDLDGPAPVLEPGAAARFRQPGGGVQDECSASAVRRRRDSEMTFCCPSSRWASRSGRLTFTLIEVPVPASASCQTISMSET